MSSAIISLVVRRQFVLVRTVLNRLFTERMW